MNILGLKRARSDAGKERRFISAGFGLVAFDEKLQDVKIDFERGANDATGKILSDKWSQPERRAKAASSNRLYSNSIARLVRAALVGS